MTKVYEYYECRHKGELVYVGQGSRGRHKHCNSGCSHVYELNKIYFLEGVDALSVSVEKEFYDKKEAEDYEMLNIRKFNPTYNKVHNNNSSNSINAKESSNIKNGLIDYPTTIGYGKNGLRYNKEKYDRVVCDFYEYIGYKSVKSRSFTLFGRDHYKSVGLYTMQNLAHVVRTTSVVTRPERNCYILFIKALEDCCGIKLIEYLDRTPNSLR